MVDRHNLTRPALELGDDGVPGIAEIPEEFLLTGDSLAWELPPLEFRRARDEPDFDSGDDYVDRQFLESGAEDGLSPEEAAMRIVDEPPGMNYDPDPGYIRWD